MVRALLCGATMTRPEGIMCGSGCISRFLFALIDRRLMGFVKWVLAFSVPFALYHSWRMWYFAWPFPNTYYAKVGAGKAFKHLDGPLKAVEINWLFGQTLFGLCPPTSWGCVGTKGWRFKSYVGMIL